MTLVVLTGSPGVGKSTVAEKALQKTDKEFKTVNYGDKMLEVAKDRGWVENRDQMRKLDPKKQKEVQKIAGEKISQMSEKQSIMVDTHSTIKTPQGYLPGIPEWVLNALDPDTIIVVEASPKEIIARREKDAGERIRDKETSKQLSEHQEMNRVAAMACAILNGSTVKIIENPDGGLEEAAESLLKVLK
ncbi:adenylate kinase [Methanonatronarchaeum sp. AMET-Sl]|uniref:adenylate kinase n=1 Tax=Methanonatronarchaeum sp. AMET-Sl TaxID=3037654 RepID=UPI00244E286B|nr:adenylate kinase [Methanonatronarchaeum sp. AMET-Sl]WGI17212.1 adenylate kinase [Methanonatronarchaeum sp. AMET-Sl]